MKARESKRWALILLAAVCGSAALASPATAAGPQVSVLYPAGGNLRSSPHENPPHHIFGGNFAVDQDGGPGQPVYARFAHANGAVALTAAGTFDFCAAKGTGGLGLRVNVAVNGQHVGTVWYFHLSSIGPTSGPLANGQQIGVVYNGPVQSSCWSGPHVHVELQGSSACFRSRPLLSPAGGQVLGVLGGGYTAGNHQTCPPGAEVFAGSIVQWNGTSWTVAKDYRRRWVPDTRTYWCLRNRGVPDAGALDPFTLDAAPDLHGIWAHCPPGDVNNSGKVDIFDLSRLLGQYGRAGQTVSDLNYDGVVNIFDLSIQLTNYQRTS